MKSTKDYFNIPIAFATDDNYAIPTAVSIKSIVNKTNTNHIFVILYKNELTKESKDLFIKAIDGTQSKIEFIDIKNMIKDVSLRISHITESTYYRFTLPLLLKEYDKCLYLDGDVIAVNDIDQLLDVELNDNEYIGGMKCPFMFGSVITEKRAHRSELGIPNLSEYINCGVLLINLKKQRELDLTDKLISMIKNNYSVQDQDIYNIVCFGHIKIIDPKYNVVPNVLEKTIVELVKGFSIKQIIEARKNPVIIHFADRRKPWKYTGMEYGTEWDNNYYLLFKNSIIGREKYIKTSFIKRKAKVIKDGFKYIFRKVFG